jgi:RNA polymerase sigma-70 factor (ECF subfamily)
MPHVVTSATGGRAAPSDELLVMRAASGDLRAFEALVRRHRTAVLRAARRLVGPDDAEDVAQDAFLRAFHRLDRLRRVGSFRAWLMRIVQHAAVDALERRRRVDDREHREEVPDVGHDRSPARLLEEDEQRTRLAQKVELLRPEHRLVLVLRDVEGWSYDEIAVATGMPLGSVKGRLHRARAEFIEVLRRNAYDWELPDGE